MLGKFECSLSHTVIQTIFVINDLKTNLLGLPAITALNLATRNESVEIDSIIEENADIFSGLGNFGAEYEIKLDKNSVPHALHAPRRVPLSQRDKIKQELERMESVDVIVKVEEAIVWCAGIVAVQKKNGSVRTCVDLKPLNKCVLREFHPLPMMYKILAPMQGAQIFNKLDANSGFWKIPLAEQSQLLTIFITPLSRYCFKKLPFGISSAPEHFQRRMNQILEGIEGVLCLIDDVLVWGKDRT